MSSAIELGITEQEFQDAMNLEKVYSFSNNAGTCAKCSNVPTHVDCNSYNFLCSNHATGRANCKRIGDDRFSTFEVDKLQRKYSSETRSNLRHSSPTPIRSSRSDRNSRSRSKHTKKRRSPSPEESDDTEASNEYHSYRSKSPRSRKIKIKNKHQASTAFDDAFPVSSSSSSSMYPPGMAGILMQSGNRPIGNPQFNGVPYNTSNSVGFGQSIDTRNSLFGTQGISQSTNMNEVFSNPLMYRFQNNMGIIGQSGQLNNSMQHMNQTENHMRRMSQNGNMMPHLSQNDNSMERISQNGDSMRHMPRIGNCMREIPQSSYPMGHISQTDNMSNQISRFNQPLGHFSHTNYPTEQSNAQFSFQPFMNNMYRPQNQASVLLSQNNKNQQSFMMNNYGSYNRPNNPFNSTPNTPSFPLNNQDFFRISQQQNQQNSYSHPQLFFPSQGFGVTSQFSNTQQRSDTPIKRTLSNSNMFGSMQGIPNSSIQKDWWD